MSFQQPFTRAQTEEKIQLAIIAIEMQEFKSIRDAAVYFKVSKTTLGYRMTGRKTRAEAHEIEQLLSNAQENTLARWITRLTATGFPATPLLIKQMAEEIHMQRVILASSQTTLQPNPTPIGYRWIYRLLERHLQFKGTYSRQLESAWHIEATPEKISAWFDAFKARIEEQKYEPCNIYNMDETGFAVRETQSTRIIVGSTMKSNWKIIAGKQEWITVLECIDADGGALPPMIIFKAKNTNIGWIPKDTPSNWHFSTSNSGWTSNSHGFKWLRKVFEPESRKKSGNRPRLLIMDGHSSHITGNMIALCMENNIDLLILPPHCSHLLQLLDVGVYGPLKRFHAQEVDRYTRAGLKRIQHSYWVEIFKSIREKGLIPLNIRSGWRAAGLIPFVPERVLANLLLQAVELPYTPHNSTLVSSLDLSVLRSSPPDGTELRHVNSVFNSTMANSNSPASPVQRYAKRMTRLVESQNTELTILRKEVKEYKEILETRKKRTKGKRIKLQGEFVFSTKEVLKIVREAELKSTAKKPHGRPCKRPIEEVEEVEEEEEEEIDSSNSESESENCVAYRTRSSRVE